MFYFLELFLLAAMYLTLKNQNRNKTPQQFCWNSPTNCSTETNIRLETCLPQKNFFLREHSGEKMDILKKKLFFVFGCWPQCSCPREAPCTVRWKEPPQPEPAPPPFPALPRGPLCCPVCPLLQGVAAEQAKALPVQSDSSAAESDDVSFSLCWNMLLITFWNIRILFLLGDLTSKVLANNFCGSP